jgi:hypothetical protein
MADMPKKQDAGMDARGRATQEQLPSIFRRALRLRRRAAEPLRSE